ncbi:urease subunit gamma/beta [Kibdelosporangium banguiense]|uniref:Urease subunit gamma n=1 Tax=Kibdelosporangium banguiense TaxID=1365924 RepID=A0ABS4TUA2_9PSEU|nr:urease subunit gamma [Kibdelosporangium banguiense]MBP2327545.1 urease subunit gamma/beta [Kibdelosporangium banguiense]
MHLTPHEQERLLIHVAADVARRRRERGLKLNYPEAVALLTVHIFEEARAGQPVKDIMCSGRKLLRREELMDGVPEMIENVQVEATFPDGTKLVTIDKPIKEPKEPPLVHPGKVDPADAGPIPFNEGLEVTTVSVRNTADRPIQVGSHYHFFEANPGLEFDRKAAYGKRLNVAAGTSKRFEPHPGTEDVELVPIAGDRVVRGLRKEVGGPLDA